MWELYVERVEGANVKTCYEFNNVKTCFECKIKMKVHYQIKNIKFLDLQIGSISKALNKCNNNSITK